MGHDVRGLLVVGSGRWSRCSSRQLDTLGVVTDHHLERVGQATVLLSSATLPEVSNLRGHLQRGR